MRGQPLKFRTWLFVYGIVFEVGRGAMKQRQIVINASAAGSPNSE